MVMVIVMVMVMVLVMVVKCKTATLNFQSHNLLQLCRGWLRTHLPNRPRDFSSYLGWTKFQSNQWESRKYIWTTRSLWARWAPTSSWRPFGHLWLRPSRPSGAQALWPTHQLQLQFLSDPGVPGVRSMGPDVTKWVRDIVAELTDVTLAYKDTNSIRTDNVNMALQGNVAIQVTLSGGQPWNPCKWRRLKTKV